MVDTYQYRKVRRFEYIPQSGKIKMNLEGTNNDYISQVDQIQMEMESSEFKMIKRLRMGKEAIYVDFTEPITCNINSGHYEDVLLCNVKMEGDNQSDYVEKLPSLKEIITSDESEKNE